MNKEMPIYGGYMGKVLKINLTTKTNELYPWSNEDRRKYLGGKIMAAKILHDLLDDDVEALSEDNVVVISTGPFTNTGAPASSRFNVSGISPLTGLVTSSNCGGDFGIMLKKAGYDALILTGKSNKKIWIEITEESIKFNSADKLWGMDVEEVQEVLPGKTGKLVIGPAGENLVKYAGLFSQERTAGRGGLGSVFGYKNIKAITCKGSLKPEIYSDKTKDFYKNWIKNLRKHPLTGVSLPKFGTAGLLAIMQQRSILATKNFSKGKYEDYETLTGEYLAENHLTRNKGCMTCPIQCGRQVEIDGKKVKGPELETLGLFGANICNDNMQLIIEWNVKLDKLGMDSISTAGSIAFAMELNEKGLWNNELEFGKTDNISKILDDIAYKKGIGADLAEGVKFLSEKYGGKEFAIHSKGMELSAYEPRSSVGQGLGYAVSNRGGCHLNAGYIVLFEGLSMNMDPYSKINKAELTIFSQDLLEVCSASGLCLFTLQAMLPAFLITNPNSLLTRIVNRFLTFNITAFVIKRLNLGKENSLPINLPNIPHSKALGLLTGMKMDLGRMKTIGERGYNLERIINLKRGLKVSDDSLPKRLTDDIQGGNPKARVPLEELKAKFYKSRGWSVDGKPTMKTLDKLGLKHG